MRVFGVILVVGVVADDRAEALKTVKDFCKQHGFTAAMPKDVLASGRKEV